MGGGCAGGAGCGIVGNMDEQALNQLLATYPGLELAFLFGSLSNGTATPESDLDLAVRFKFDQPITAELKQQMIEDLALLSNRPVDLIDLRTASVMLVRQVFKGRRVFGNATAHGELLARHLRDVADFMPLIEEGLQYRREQWINS